MRTHPTFFLGSVLGSALALASTGALAAAAAVASTQIYQQRTADGRILLTDRPSPTATTERSWQLSPEDAAAARQRALDVKLEAQAVTERVQRSIDLQRMVVARATPMTYQRTLLEPQGDDDMSYGYGGGGGLLSPYLPGQPTRGRNGGYGGYGGYGGNVGGSYGESPTGRPVGLGDGNRFNSYHGSRPNGARRSGSFKGSAGPGSR